MHAKMFFLSWHHLFDFGHVDVRPPPRVVEKRSSRSLLISICLMIVSLINAHAAAHLSIENNRKAALVLLQVNR